MINISDVSKAIWHRDTAHKEMTIRIPGKNKILRNADIRWEKFELSETLETSEQLTFTGCNASRVRFECEILPEDIRGEYIEASIQADGADSIPLFAGYVDTQERPTPQDLSCKITAYDKLYQLRALNLSEWFEGLTFPMTLKVFRQQLAAVCGIEVVPCELLFDNLMLKKTISATSIGAIDLWRSICMLNAVYGRINRVGKFEFLTLPEDTGLYPSEDLYPGEDLYPEDTDLTSITPGRYKKLKYDGYMVDYIDKVQIHEAEDDVGGIYGEGTNAYIVEGNWLTFGRGDQELQSMAEALYGRICNYSYMPAQITAPALPYVELGDMVETETRTEGVMIYVLQRTMKGIQSPEDVYIATGTKERRKAVEDVNYEFEQISSKYNKLNRTVEGLTLEVYDSETGKSRIEQNAEEITARVEKTGGNQSFSWELLADGFVLKAGDKEVFRCDANGITVSGYATSTRMESAEANITNLFANEAQLGNLIGEKASITDLQAAQADITALYANEAQLGSLIAGKASISSLNAVSATVNSVVTATTNANEGQIVSGSGKFGRIGLFDGSGYRKFGITKLHYGTADYYFVTAPPGDYI